MKKENFLREQTINRIHEKSGINTVSGVDLIVVDIQPEYADYMGFKIYQFTEFLNENYESLRSLTFLYNGADTLGMVSESDFKIWLLENELDEEVLDFARFYDKGYAFFRYCMDSDIDEDDVANLVKFMIKHNINDTRDIDENMWNLYMKEYDIQDVRDLLEHADDMINIPELIDFIRDSGYVNILLCGGGINECLKEVEIALMAMDKNYRVLTKYTY
mgnify:CR=1 FL=1